MTFLQLNWARGTSCGQCRGFEKVSSMCIDRALVPFRYGLATCQRPPKPSPFVSPDFLSPEKR